MLPLCGVNEEAEFQPLPGAVNESRGRRGSTGRASSRRGGPGRPLLAEPGMAWASHVRLWGTSGLGKGGSRYSGREAGVFGTQKAHSGVRRVGAE